MPTRKRAARPHHVILDGAEAVLVPLHGKHARGRKLILDRHVFELLSQLYDNSWVLTKNHDTVAVMGSLRRRGTRSGVNPRIVLARHITVAQPGELVRFSNGDRCDLRLANLKVGPGTPAADEVQPDLHVQLAWDADEALQTARVPTIPMLPVPMHRPETAHAV